MKIAFNPSTVAALITPPNNKDITFDLRGRNIFARGVKFCGTDTWRDIKINNVSIGSNILDLRNGSNTTLTNTNGVVTINSTWRPVVDNLTSDSTTSSLSANQGRVLVGLINGKSDSGHNHDDRYVKKSGDTMSGVLTIDTTNFGALTIKRNDDANGASIQFRGKSSVYGYIGLNNSTKDKQFLRWGSDTSKTYTILDTSSTYTSNGKGIINGTTITQVDNATSSGNADKVDGYHASALLTSVTNTNNGISVTVGGTTKSVSNISVNYANSAGSATKVIVNQHTTNDVNYPLVWSNQNNTNNVTENQLFKSWSDLYYNPKNKRLTVGGSIYAAHFYEHSDKTLKKNIKSILSSTNIPKIREFDWKDTEEHSYGFIAQELEEQGYGCLVSEANGKKTVNYTATLALTVAKLQNLINIQNKKISNLTKKLKALKYGRKKNS